MLAFGDRRNPERSGLESWTFQTAQPTTPWAPYPATEFQPRRSTLPSWVGLPSSLQMTNPLDYRVSTGDPWANSTLPQKANRMAATHANSYSDANTGYPSSPEDQALRRDDSGLSLDSTNIGAEPGTDSASTHNRKTGQFKRRTSNRDEFDGPHQFLDKPLQDSVLVFHEHDLPQLPTSLLAAEQDDLLGKVNDCLSRCAFDFVAKYQFPIPLEPDKRRVSMPSDREWTEWVYLLKRLATKRRIPARVLYNGQIKQFVTVLENSLEMRHAAKHQSRPLKDDRNILQLVSAGTQVAKILKDAPAMTFLDSLYTETESLINSRKNQGSEITTWTTYEFDMPR